MIITDIEYIGRYNYSNNEIWKIGNNLYLLENYFDGRFEATPMTDEFTIDKDKKPLMIEQVLEGIGQPHIDNDGCMWYDEYKLLGFSGL